MIAATEGIVLHSVKYGESSVIATIFTKEFGRQSYMINAARSKKSKNKASLLQPMFLVELEAYQKQSRDLQRIRAIKSLATYQDIPFDIVKSTQAIFLAELLYKTIHEQESYPELFEFIKHALLYLDLMDEGKANFHLYFLFHLTEYLGFMPDTTMPGFEGWLDLQKGVVVPFEPSHPMFANKEATAQLVKLALLKINELDQLKIKRSMRDSLLESLVDYYRLHFDTLGEIKSLKVLQEIFS
ncbi:DNA repair protein RecO [Draconibacterium sp. IB214405]|uniref:DNA repair protein RecO n=1 Tax=Draconibacterium sp. IB214405 TaxID=3097352 RepID=UPI002A0CA98F|nr:DNA repair protein RecO [Draconibacterium sp. IB214405]MDX8337940.1 DNA repair protein RecO [Draconibacterium sp. IB214405]